MLKSGLLAIRVPEIFLISKQKTSKTNKKEIIFSRSWEIIITAAKTWKVAYFNIMKTITQNEQTQKIKKKMTLKKKLSLIENEKR